MPKNLNKILKFRLLINFLPKRASGLLFGTRYAMYILSSLALRVAPLWPHATGDSPHTQSGKYKTDTAFTKSMLFATIEGRKAAFRVSPAHKSDKPTVLCIHCSGGDSSVWSSQLAGLAGDCTIVAPDLPGHGKTEGRGGYTQTEREVLLCAFQRNELSRLKRLIHQIDPDAFVIIGSVHEVLGEGFQGLAPARSKPHRS